MSCDAFGSPAQTEEDQAVRKLQAFFSQEEHVRKETSARFTLDSIELFLFNDSDEVSIFENFIWESIFFLVLLASVFIFC